MRGPGVPPLTGRVLAALVLTQITASSYALVRTWYGLCAIAVLVVALILLVLLGGSLVLVVGYMVAVAGVVVVTAVSIVLLNLSGRRRWCWYTADGRALITAHARRGVVVPGNACARPVGQGRATELLDAAVELADIEQIPIEVAATNARIAALYTTRYGFRSVGRTLGRPSLRREPIPPGSKR